MSQVTPVPEGFHAVTPHVTVSPCAEAIAFYAKAFGAVEISRMPGPGGLIMHSMIRIGDSMMMLNDQMDGCDMPGGPVFRAPRNAASMNTVLHIYTATPDKLFNDAVAAGAKAMMPLSEMPWGDRYGMVVDPFGVVWSIAAHVEDVSPEEIGRRMQAMMAGGPPK